MTAALTLVTTTWSLPAIAVNVAVSLNFKWAAATAAVNGSLPHLRAMVQAVATNQEEKRLLPLFYLHLDPTKIPSEVAMDVEVLSTDTMDTIIRAFLCVQGLYNSAMLPPGSHPDLWERVWPWAQFLFIHRPRIPDAPTGDMLRASVFSIIAGFNAIPSRLASTPEIGILAAHAWGIYFRDPNAISERALRSLTLFLGMGEEYRLDEFIEGAGSMDALAVLVVELLDYLLNDIAAPDRIGRNLWGVVKFAGCCEDAAWLSALRSHQYMRAMVSVLLFAQRLIVMPTKQRPFYFQELYNHAWNGFLRLCPINASYTGIVEAVDAGLLELIAWITGRNIHGITYVETRVRGMLKFVLQPATVYYPVLAALERTLPLIRPAMSAPVFISSALYPDWRNFVSLVLERLEVKKMFDSGGHIACRACDNLKCGKISKKTDFKRCAGCEYQYYCSKECQIRDWRTDHRESCRHMRRMGGWHLDHLDGPAYLAGRDRAFLRFLVAHDYARHKLQIFLDRIVQIHQHGESVVTLFDYCQGFVQIVVKPLQSEDKKREYFARARRGSRRLHPNVIIVADCRGHEQQWIRPIRSSASNVHDTLFQLSQGLPSGTNSVADLSPAVHRAVMKLVETACPQMQEII
ncbi:hypothetical protein C8R45DRAFT_948039 [Mycena sanguinolenta]|nr:hypothetical protein C8R45DRAFT_948039 [Mycena sanguinolenta]